MVNIYCHLDNIQNHYRNKPFCMSMGEFLDWVHWNEKMNIKCGWVHSLDCGAGLSKKAKVNWEPAFISPYWLTVDSLWPDAYHFYFQAFSAMINGTLKLWDRTDCLLLMLLGQVFIHITHYVITFIFICWQFIHIYVLYYGCSSSCLLLFLSHFCQLHSFLPNSLLYLWSFISYVDQGYKV